MVRIGAALLVAAMTAGLIGLVEGQDSARQAHGIFTGDLKAVLYVADVESSAAFFRDRLGFEFDGFANRSDGTPYYAEMLAGDRKFGLHEPTSQRQEARIGQARLYFRVLDLDAHRRRVSAWGLDPGEIIETGWMDMLILQDPDGNEIVFAVTDPSRHSTDPWRTGRQSP